MNGLLHHPTSGGPHPTSVGPSGQGHGEAFHVAAGPQGILRSCLAVFFPGLKDVERKKRLKKSPKKKVVEKLDLSILFWEPKTLHIKNLWKFNIATEMVHLYSSMIYLLKMVLFHS